MTEAIKTDRPYQTILNMRQLDPQVANTPKINNCKIKVGR